MVNEDDPEPRKIFKSLIGTSVTHLDLRTNFFDCNILKDLKEVIPKLRLKSLDLRDNRKKHTQEFEKSVIYIVRNNIFLENVKIEKFSKDSEQKLNFNLRENICIRHFFRIFLANYGPRRIGLMDAQKTHSIRDVSRLRLDLDVRRIINQFIPRNIEEGVDYFISWLLNIKECLDNIREYNISSFISDKNDILMFEENAEMISFVINKLNRYARYHGYIVTGKKKFYSNLTIENTKPRGRKPKSSKGTKSVKPKETSQGTSSSQGRRSSQGTKSSKGTRSSQRTSSSQITEDSNYLRR